MAPLAETRDLDTGNHIRRTQHYVKALAEKLRTHPRFASVLTDNYIQMLFKSAPLHDIGKVGIPDRILLKPGRLTPEEFEIMKTHTILGRDAIEHAEIQLGMPVEFLSTAKEIALSGKVGRLWLTAQASCGEAIAAGLMAVADVYDALHQPPGLQEQCSTNKRWQSFKRGGAFISIPTSPTRLWSCKRR